jgi:hypothetical protein
MVATNAGSTCMNKHLHVLLRRLPIYGLVRRTHDARALKQWEAAGRPVPPPYVHKRAEIRDYGRRFGLRTLVETGTYFGDTVEELRGDFDTVYTVELDDYLHRAAARRFRGIPGVRLLHGDSGRMLPQILGELKADTLFWLDGHYSGGFTACGELGCPLELELEAIFAHPRQGHVVLIDDARLFGLDPAYPTIERLRGFVAARRPALRMEVRHDVIRLVPESLLK